MQVRGKIMHNTSFYQTNEAINQLTEEFSQLWNKVLNRVNVLTHVHTTMLENKNEPSLLSTDIGSLSNTKTINSTISNGNCPSKLFHLTATEQTLQNKQYKRSKTFQGRIVCTASWISNCRVGLNITLNTSHTQSSTPFKYQSKLSAYTYFFGQFDFNKTPLAPPSNRTSWDLNGKIGYYTGPAPNYYICMTYYLPSTNIQIISNTLVFIPHTIPIPTITTNNFLTQAASGMVTLLKCPPFYISSSLQIGNSVKNAIL